MCNGFYVYVYLDPTKIGRYNYGIYHFDYEPFYVGKGKNYRLNTHLKENKNTTCNLHKYNKIQKIERCKLTPIVFKFKDNLEEKEASELEINLIKTIGRKDKTEGPLVNMTDGGEGASGRIVSEKTKLLRSKTIYQYDKDMNFIKEYIGIRKTAELVGCPVNDIDTTNKKTSGGYIWSRHILTDEEKQTFILDERLKRVYQYDLDGNFIKEYCSIREASKETNLSYVNISKNCRGLINSTDGYIWSLVNDFGVIRECIDKIKNEGKIKRLRYDKTSKRIYQYDLDGNFIKEYCSMVQASLETNITDANIRNVCKGKNLTAGGFVWSYIPIKDFSFFKHIKYKKIKSKGYNRPIIQYDLDGNFIKEYCSIKDASISTNINRTTISCCTRSIRKTAGNFVWKYKELIF